jgi:gas vesicle protein
MIGVEYLAVIGTLAGAFIGSLSALLITWITKRSEERKHFRELVIKTALEHYKEQVEVSKIQRQTHPVQILPLDIYIIHMLKFSELALIKKIDTSNVEKILAEAEEITNIAIKYKEKKQQQRPS